MILDMTCGPRMTWFQKDRPDVIYCDKRQFEETKYGQQIKVHPDVICDSRRLPFGDNTFSGAYFDPPHIVRFNNMSWMAKKYSMLFTTWKEDLKECMNEAHRVTKPGSLICVKWSEIEIPKEDLFESIGLPCFGTRTGKNNKTWWLVYISEDKQ